jgi:hypothetical protein
LVDQVVTELQASDSKTHPTSLVTEAEDNPLLTRVPGGPDGFSGDIKL